MKKKLFLYILKQLIIKKINYNNFVTIFYIKIKIGRKVISYNVDIIIKFCILSLLENIYNIKKIKNLSCLKK